MVASKMKVLLPVAIAVFWTPIPTRLGFWKFVLHGMDPGLVGLLPCTVPSKDEWGFTFEDLYDERRSLEGQTALVTGANSGTGYEIALALARLGATVTLACRTPSKCDAAVGRIRNDPAFLERNGDGVVAEDGEGHPPRVTSMTVDTSSLGSVKSFCELFLEKNEGVPLDMLFLNAGIGAIGTLPDGTNRLSVDGIELTFATNVVGHHLMYKLLAPIIVGGGKTPPPRKAPARIVLTSSSASYGDYLVPPDLKTLNSDPIVDMSHYGMSKLAQIWWARELTSQLDDETAAAAAAADVDDPNSIVYVNAGHPGAAATNIWEAILNPTTHIGRSLLSFAKSLMWTSEEGALTLLYLGVAVDDLAEKGVRGKYFHPQTRPITEHRNVYADEGETNVRQKAMWKFLDELVGEHVA